MKLHFNTPKRILVCGGRHFDNYGVLELALDSVLHQLDITYDECEIVEGGCKGVDILAYKYAKNHGIRVTQFNADWGKFGKAAGPIRNSEMITYVGESDYPILVAFVSDTSKGTLDTVNKAKSNGFTTYLFNYNNEDVYLNLFE